MDGEENLVENNLIDSFMERRMKQVHSKGSRVKGGSSVADMTQKRSEILESERRSVKRTILSEFIGAHVVVPGKGLKKVSLYNISQEGLAFDMEEKDGSFALNEELAMRVYLNHKTYFPFTVKVENARVEHDEEVVRHGVSYIQGGFNDEALGHFVNFIETVSASLVTDAGDIMVSNLGN